MGRRRGKQSSNSSSSKTPSSSYYIGYVEDDESIEAIEKKFEALAKIEKEFREARDEPEEGSAVPDEIEPKEEGTPSNQDGLSEEHLQRIFQDTSSFTVESALDNNEGLFEQQQGYEDVFLDEYEDEYDLSEDEFWDDQPRKKKGKNKRTGGGDRQQIARPQSQLLMGVPGSFGNIIALKKRRKIDPNQLVYCRFPMSPLPLSWALPIETTATETYDHSEYIYKEVKDVTKFNFPSLGKDFEGVYVDPPWHSGFKPASLKKLKIENVVTSGLLFIWVEKEYIPDILEIYKDKFVYVENITWVTLTVGNRAYVEKSTYLGKAKKIVLVLRRTSKQSKAFQLKHQRNPDTVFDTCRWKDGRKGEYENCSLF
mmetsp:Transcript_44552/g.115862  ORF Transcript_44552/g.115862 Transcript_44552/m.115862 type:complete len:369 (-) Transcript_44552:417-1523(-)